jgi:hypothetical protein
MFRFFRRCRHTGTHCGRLVFEKASVCETKGNVSIESISELMMLLMTRMDLCRYDIKCVIDLVCWPLAFLFPSLLKHTKCLFLYSLLSTWYSKIPWVLYYEWSKCI